MAIRGPVGQHSFYDGRQEFERGLLPPTFRGGTFQLPRRHSCQLSWHLLEYGGLDDETFSYQTISSPCSHGRPAGADISTSPDLITESLASTPNYPHFLLDYMHELDAISIETGPIPRILLYCVQTSPGSVRRFLYAPTDPDLELPMTRHRVLPRTFIQVPGKLNLTGCDPFRINCQIT